MARVTLHYYAQLREQAGRGSEVVDTDAADLAALYAVLAQRHGFSLPQHLLKVAVDDAFADWERRPLDGDEIVFIPPVAGG